MININHCSQSDV